MPIPYATYNHTILVPTFLYISFIGIIPIVGCDKENAYSLWLLVITTSLTTFLCVSFIGMVPYRPQGKCKFLMVVEISLIQLSLYFMNHKNFSLYVLDVPRILSCPYDYILGYLSLLL